MNNLTILAIYTAMLVFDFAVLAGAAYLIADRGWSSWWLLAAVLICAGSNPINILKAWK